MQGFLSLGRSDPVAQMIPFCHLCFLYVGSILQQFLPNRSVLSETRMRTYASLIFPDMNLLACMLCPMLNQTTESKECKVNWSRPSLARLGKIILTQVWTWTERVGGSVSLRKTRMSLLVVGRVNGNWTKKTTDGYLSQVYRLCFRQTPW